MANWTDYTWILVVGSLAAFFTAFGIGANDVANAFGSSVAARTLTMRQALLIASVCEFSGSVLLGAEVTSTVAGGIARISAFEEDPEVYMYGMLCALVASGTWLLLATYLSLPVSTTHATIGGVLGFAFVYGGANAVVWLEPQETFPYMGGLVPIILAWFTSPLMSGLATVFLFVLVRSLILRRDNSLEYAIWMLPVLVLVTVFINLFFVLYKGGEARLDWGSGKCAWVSAAAAGGCAALTALVGVPFLKRRVHIAAVARSQGSNSRLQQEFTGTRPSMPSEPTTTTLPRLSAGPKGQYAGGGGGGGGPRGGGGDGGGGVIGRSMLSSGFPAVQGRGPGDAARGDQPWGPTRSFSRGTARFSEASPARSRPGSDPVDQFLLQQQQQLHQPHQLQRQQMTQPWQHMPRAQTFNGVQLSARGEVAALSVPLAAAAGAAGTVTTAVAAAGAGQALRARSLPTSPPSVAEEREEEAALALAGSVAARCGPPLRPPGAQPQPHPPQQRQDEQQEPHRGTGSAASHHQGHPNTQAAPRTSREGLPEGARARPSPPQQQGSARQQQVKEPQGKQGQGQVGQDGREQEEPSDMGRPQPMAAVAADVAADVAGMNVAPAVERVVAADGGELVPSVGGGEGSVSGDPAAAAATATSGLQAVQHEVRQQAWQEMRNVPSQAEQQASFSQQQQQQQQQLMLQQHQHPHPGGLWGQHQSDQLGNAAGAGSTWYGQQLHHQQQQMQQIQPLPMQHQQMPYMFPQQQQHQYHYQGHNMQQQDGTWLQQEQQQEQQQQQPPHQAGGNNFGQQGPWAQPTWQLQQQQQQQAWQLQMQQQQQWLQQQQYLSTYYQQQQHAQGQAQVPQQAAEGRGAEAAAWAVPDAAGMVVAHGSASPFARGQPVAEATEGDGEPHSRTSRRTNKRGGKAAAAVEAAGTASSSPSSTTAGGERPRPTPSPQRVHQEGDHTSNNAQFQRTFEQLKAIVLHGTDVDVHECVELGHDPVAAAMHAHAEVFDPSTEHAFKYLQVVTAICDSFSHGANDVANSVGPLAAIQYIYKYQRVDFDSTVPIWVLILGGAGIVLGLAMYGYNIIRAIGVRLAVVTPSRGFCIELSTALVVVLASKYGLPISTTHCQVGATAGMGLLEGSAGLNWPLAAQFFLGWLVTLLFTALLSAAIFAAGAYSPSINQGNDINAYESAMVAIANRLDLILNRTNTAALSDPGTWGNYSAALASQLEGDMAWLQLAVTPGSASATRPVQHIAASFLTAFFNRTMETYINNSLPYIGGMGAQGLVLPRRP